MPGRSSKRSLLWAGVAPFFLLWMVFSWRRFGVRGQAVFTRGKDAQCPLSAQAAVRGVGAVWGGMLEAQAVERVPSAPAVCELWK